ncbi:hypothetical protein LZ012_17225 [Dechloromonas sp. XY25]|uniref:PhnA-like protein n=1 Tax=Dechloromonas hankyongensis TaxID=2908002 RepID=A0ABS9K6E2_9RHOO|nr:hypothetical protein [Dechloromonas hankyongensis]MCG2578742.1 hypothetical protein [Dechloromonas hankyongensis]
MAVNIITPTTVSEPYHLPQHALSWGGIVAGLSVGIAINLLLLLIGAATGLAMFDAGDARQASQTGVSMAVAIWNTISMVIAAFAGGYVAARTAGMRRASDGVLHGVVAWGATLLISVFVLSTVAGTTLGTLFNAVTPAERMAGSEIAGKLDAGNRQEAITAMRERFGLSNEQASQLVDQALVLSGRENQASPQAREATENTLHNASIASGWLSVAILLSLLSAVGGGVLGARGTRRDVRRPVSETTASTTL